MNEKDIPNIMKNIMFDFKWDNQKVWRLKVPVEEMDIKKLIWHFDYPFHWHKNGIFNLKPIEVINNPDEYNEEYERAMKSNLKYPIDTMWNKGRWLILDGLHRLMKARILGMKKVNVRKIPRSKIKEILK